MFSRLIYFCFISSHLNGIFALDKAQVAKCPSSSIPNEIVIPPSLKPKGHNDTLIFQMKKSTLQKRFCKGIWVDHSVHFTYSEKVTSVRFLKNGIALINKAYYNTDEYCFSRLDSHVVTVSHCKIKCSPFGPFICIPKCCPLNYILKISENEGHSCVRSEENEWFPRIYSSKSDFKAEDTSPLDLNSTEYKLHYELANDVYEDVGLPIFYKTITYKEFNGESYENVTTEGSTFRLLDNGSVSINETDSDGTESWPIHTKFCIDGHIVEGERYMGNEADQILFLASVENESTTKTEIKVGFIIFGIVFLVLTVIMYLVIWDKHNIHGWTIFSFVVSMLVFFLNLAAIHIIQMTKDVRFLESNTCLTVAILCHFTFINTLCWMSVINFDFWATFRNLSPSQERNKNFRRYCYYFTFALAVPSAIVGFSMILHFSVPYKDHSGFLPGYAQLQSCNLHQSSTKLYLYTPMALLLSFNLVMFTWTVFTLWTYKRKTQAASGASGQKQSWVLFCKLFFVMGITWILEALSGFLDWDFIYFDIVNLLQAFAIFVIFAAKRENLLWIYKKYPSTKGLIVPILRMKCCYVSELDAEQTEMTSADKNRTLKSRISSGSDNEFK